MYKLIHYDITKSDLGEDNKNAVVINDFWIKFVNKYVDRNQRS